jgi:hypothetical protein
MGKTAASLSTQTVLLQLPPVGIRIIDRNFTSGGHSARDHEYAFYSPPVELLKLAIGATRVIYEASKIAHLALEDLV